MTFNTTLFSGNFNEVFNDNKSFIFQVNFELFFNELFSDTKIGKLPDNQRIIVREPKYYQQLNSALEADSDFTKEGLGTHLPVLILSFFYLIKYMKTNWSFTNPSNFTLF